MKQTAIIWIAVAASMVLTACGQESSVAPAGDLENGVFAIEDAMTKPSESNSSNSASVDDLRGGSSEGTLFAHILLL